MASQEQILLLLEDMAAMLRKTQVNLKKCPKARLTKGYIEARLKIIQDYWNAFRNAHQDLVKITPKEQRGTLSYFLNEEYYLYEDLYSILQADLKDMLNAINDSSSENKGNMSTSFHSQNSVIQLPKIQLPVFQGNYEHWPTFKDLFTSLVHDNNSLSDVQKLHYLKTSVTGEAASLLKHIQVTSSNYTPAWEILTKRYGNKRLILNCNMKTLFNQKKMTTQSAVQLKGLLDTTTETLNNIENLGIITGSWDPIIIYLLIQKLDPETHKSWEEYAYREDTESLPAWSDFRRFLESKFRTLELVTAGNYRETKQFKERSYHVAAPTPKRECDMCQENHTLCHCKTFINLEPKDRSDYAKQKNLCFNCLVPGHSSSKCRLPVSCRICKRRHHSLLHDNTKQDASVTMKASTPLASQHVVEEEEVHVNTMIASHHITRQGIALLATAMVEATNEQGLTISLRALIDQGSQATFISEKAAQALKLKRQPMKGSVVGVGSMKTEIKHLVRLQIRSQLDRTSLSIQAYVMSKQLTTKIPTKSIPKQTWPHLVGINLADPNYNQPGSIDLLLGVKEYAMILQQDLIKGPPGSPCAQKTSLGWILFGEINEVPSENTYVVMHHQINVEDMMKQFWEIEEENQRKLTREEKLCEDIYESTTKRNIDGRYIVKLPFKKNSPQSPEGNTKEIAKQRFTQLERKFRKQPELRKEYTKVMMDYIIQNHIEKIPESEKGNKKTVYLPHHAVIREDKETTRTRVVFDASCKGSNNVSLNDDLLVGPQLQEDLRNILTRWRMKRVAFVADITQMYRQIIVNPTDVDYQRLFWRSQEDEELEEYRLLRVTFGTSSAPYLAVKTLQRVADDEGKDNTASIKSIKENFYMDDYLDGADSEEEGIRLAKEVTNILQKGGFQLTKWSSNNINFMNSIEEDKRSVKTNVDFNHDGTIKTLGIIWNLRTDTFQYSLTITPTSGIVTKRSILSDIQKLFDPLGWIAPCTVNAKLLMQKLWMARTDWDEWVGEILEEEWNRIKTDFTNINNIKVNRWLGVNTINKCRIQLHGFSDASMKAYAAAVFVRIETTYKKFETKLIAARTRVAPLKTISLPRLELCGALLLSRLMKQIGKAMRIPTSDMYAWTDSTIVIAWLSGEPNRWKSFVANRVVEIVENLNNNHWHHVPSQDNPADLASRGMLLSTLKHCDLWWTGPHWLSEREIKINQKDKHTTNLEMKTITTYHITEEKENSVIRKMENFDNLTDLLKAIAYSKRFLNFKRNLNKVEGYLTTQELNESLMACIKIVQRAEYKDEIDRLEQNKQLKKKSSIRSLNPFLDDEILRVGGRLRHTNLPNDRKHPIILSNCNSLTSLIVADAHARTLHGGVQLMLSYLRSKYWIIRAKSVAKRHVHRCLTCAKQRATTKAQIMGDLPAERVTPTRPFLHCGVDFAGPFQISMSRGRGNKLMKAYVAIFICMSTKAIHIELVGDLTSESFIGAFRRFTARRGKCSHMWSDQGRNFVGANKELQEAWEQANLEFTGEIAQKLATDGTQWHFIPAYSPNFGGLWEAGVKSIKYHLKRILTSNLTFEEMTTVLCQVEACLNSRPLCPLDDTDPDNLNPLTPGHFLIGDAPLIVPSPDTKDLRTSSLSRWQHTQKLLQDFWRRWQDEYLSRLQQRPKWLKREDELQIGDIVMIKSENLPPGKWSLGRVMEKHPGSDGLTRVYSVRSNGAVTKRTITKLCPLPLNNTP